MKNKLGVLLNIVFIIFTLGINLASAIPKPTEEPTIRYIGYKSVNGGVKFTYKIEAGSKDLNYWDLYSCAFTHYKIIDSSEIVHHPDNKDHIRFTKPIKSGESRKVWFTLQMSYYGLAVGDIQYELKSANTKLTGEINGPICPQDYVTQVSFKGALQSSSLAIVVALAVFLKDK